MGMMGIEERMGVNKNRITYTTFIGYQKLFSSANAIIKL